MVLNDNLIGSSIYSGYPLAMGPLLSEEQLSSQDYNGMTEAEKERLIFQCKDAKTTDAMNRIVDSVTSDIDARALMEAADIDNSYKDSLK